MYTETWLQGTACKGDIIFTDSYIKIVRVTTSILAKARELGFARKLKIATWKFVGLCIELKQKEISEILNIVGGQETWDKVMLMGISGLESLVLIRIIIEEREGLDF